MAININPYNASGLSALAGKQAANLNLPLFGRDILQARLANAQMQQQGQQQQALLARDYQKMAQEQQLAQQGFQQEDYLQDKRIAGQMSQEELRQQAQLERQGMQSRDKQMELMQRQMQHQDKFGLDQQQLAVDAQYKQQQIEQQEKDREIEQMKAAVESRLKMDDKEREERAAISGSYLLSRQEIQDPAQQEVFDKQYMDMLVSNGKMSKAEADSFLKIPVDMRASMAMQDYMITQKASEVAKLIGKGKAAGGSMKMVAADGTMMEYSPLDKTVTKDFQKDLVAAKTTRKKLESLMNDYVGEYLTTRGSVESGLAKHAERTASIPGYGLLSKTASSVVSGRTPEEQKEHLKQRTKFANKAEQIFQSYRKETTGTQAGEKEIAELRRIFLNTDMSESEFRGAVEAILDAVDIEAGIKKQTMVEGGVEIGASQSKSPSISREDAIAELKRRGKL